MSPRTSLSERLIRTSTVNPRTWSIVELVIVVALLLALGVWLIPLAVEVDSVPPHAIRSNS